MASRSLTLMTVHAHPDDESIGTGGLMAKTAAAGHRVVLVTCTRGELGEIVVPELDTDDNHRRLGEIRAGELQDALTELGVTEWENLGYRDSDMMGRAGNNDPRSFWRANIDEAIGRLVWLMRRYRPDVVTTYNDYGGYGHPDHINSHYVAVGAFERAGDPRAYPEQVSPEHGGSGPTEAEGGVVPWSPSKLYEQAFPESSRRKLGELMAEAGQEDWTRAAEDATPEQRAEFEERSRRMLVPDDQVTTWIDVGGAPLEQKWRAMQRHVTQIGSDFPFIAIGFEAWREVFGKEAFILRSSRVESTIPETDVFAGLG